MDVGEAVAEAFEFAMRIDYLRMCFVLHSRYQKHVEEAAGIADSVVHSLAHSSCYVSEKLFFLLRLRRALTLKQSEAFLEIVEGALYGAQPGGRGEKLFTTRNNALKTIFNYVKILRKVSSRFAQLAVRSKTIEINLTRVAISFVKSIQNSEELTYLLMDKNAAGETTLDLITS